MEDLKFKESYEAVFNEDGTIKNCGREACKRLIEACKKKDPETDFGDVNTGKICLSNLDVIRKLYLDAN